MLRRRVNKSYHFNLGAINKDTNEYVSPIFAEKKDKHKFICPECKEQIGSLAQGSKVRWHFRHKKGSICGYYNNPNEGAIHKEAKYRIYNLLKQKNHISFKTKCTKCRCNTEKHITNDGFYDNIKVGVDDKQFKWDDKSIQPDVYCLDRSFPELPKFIVEIYNTHFTLNRPEPWVEFDVRDIFEKTDDAENKKNKSYVFNCIRKRGKQAMYQDKVILCDDCTNIAEQRKKKREREKREYEEAKIRAERDRREAKFREINLEKDRLKRIEYSNSPERIVEKDEELIKKTESYVKTLTVNEIKVYNIAKEFLGSSFDIEKSHGFINLT